MKYVQIDNVPNKRYLTKMMIKKNLPGFILVNIVPLIFVESGYSWIMFICSIMFIFTPSQQANNTVYYRIKIHNSHITAYYYFYFCKKRKTLPLNRIGVEMRLEKENSYISIHKKGNPLCPTLSGFQWNKYNNSLCTKQNIIDMAEMLERYKDEMLYFRRR